MNLETKTRILIIPDTHVQDLSPALLPSARRTSGQSHPLSLPKHDVHLTNPTQADSKTVSSFPRLLKSHTTLSP